MAWANSKIHTMLEQNYTVFDALVRILVEGVHKVSTLKEAYTVDGKLNSKKVMNDVRAMYTCLETYNTLNIIDVDEQYISNILKEMYNGIEK